MKKVIQVHKETNEAFMLVIVIFIILRMASVINDVKNFNLLDNEYFVQCIKYFKVTKMQQTTEHNGLFMINQILHEILL